MHHAGAVVEPGDAAAGGMCKRLTAPLSSVQGRKAGKYSVPAFTAFVSRGRWLVLIKLCPVKRQASSRTSSSSETSPMGGRLLACSALKARHRCLAAWFVGQ